MISPTRRRPFIAVALLGGAALALAACVPGPGESEEAGEQPVTVTFRIWDDAAATAYEESFEAFTEHNPGIVVEVETVPWADYWDLLPQDIDGGTMADIFWTNTSNFARYADNGSLIDVGEAIGDDHEPWTRSVVGLYHRNGVQWGIPQLWDSIALFYNVDLVEEAGVDPEELRWDPEGSNDTLVPAATSLTLDDDGNHPDEEGFDEENIDQFGFNSQPDLQAVWLNFLAENGGQFQGPGDQYTFAPPAGVGAFQYLVDLVNTHHVAPAAADTIANPGYARELFLRGDLALFQSGSYSLPHMTGAGFDWDLAPKIEGPQGRVSVVHAVAAVGNAGTDNPEETAEVMRWLGTAEGQRPLAERGVGLPGAVEAQEAYVDYWAEQDVDVQVFIDAAEGATVPAPQGPRASAGANEITPVFEEMWAGRIEVPDALDQAQDAANEAISE